MIHGITFATENMSESAELCRVSMFAKGVDNPKVYRPSDISTEFKVYNREIFKHERGFAYWVWKSYFIYKELLTIPENSLLIYSDAGVEFIASVSHIIDRMDEDIFFFGNNYNHVDWCKMDVMETICPDSGWRTYITTDAKQVQASVIFFRNTQKVRDFVKSWLLYCQMPNFIDDSKSNSPNFMHFQEHRHDQAILTCLQIKHGYKLHWWPASYNDGAFTYDKIEQYQNDNYPVIFHHHRKRQEDWK
jgi:hypothetical protein